MPSKAFLLTLGNAGAVVKYAHDNLGCQAQVQEVKISGGLYSLTLLKNDQSTFVGTGANKLEAAAEAVASEFPAMTFPDPQP